MPSKLESEILIPEELLAIVGLELRPNEVVVDVASWEEPSKRGRLHFAACRFRSFSVTYSDEDFEEEPNQLDFPWDPTGFDSDLLDNGMWRFTLHTHVLEIVFDGAWPSFTKL